jgi:phosphoglycolate phosphatase
MSIGSAPYHVLLCDLDGTLVDSVPDLRRALNKLLLELNLPAQSLEAVKGMVGNGVAKLVARGLAAAGASESPEEGPDLVERFLYHYDAGLVIDTRPYPGAAMVLRGLKSAGWRLAICTNKPEAPSRKILEALDLADLFEAVAGGDSFPVRKPDPGHLLGLLEAMGADPAAAIMLGDSRADAEAARAAGLPAVLVRFGYSPGTPLDALADRMIDRYEELPEALGQIAARRGADAR